MKANTSHMPPSTLFESSPAVKELGGIIERISYIGACELFLPFKEVSLRAIRIEEPAILGALLERQIQSLDIIRHKENVLPVLYGVLQDTVDVYRTAKMPLRETRVLLRAMELGYHSGPDKLVGIGTPEQVREHMQKLFSREVGIHVLDLCTRNSCHFLGLRPRCGAGFVSVTISSENVVLVSTPCPQAS
jgi:separase